MGAGQWLSFGPSKSRTMQHRKPGNAKKWSDIAQATAAANRIQAMRKNEDGDGQGISLDDQAADEDVRGVKVELRDVWFRYPTRDVPVLNGLSMTVSTPPTGESPPILTEPDRERTVRGHCRPFW